MLVSGGCSMKKNTWSSRAFQSLNTRYNVYFNGKQSYDEGLKAISEANKDDYSHIIAMYPVSHHDNAAAATSQMDRTIEKCRKAIKTRSVKTKPELSRSKRYSAKGKAFMKKEEYNPFMDEVWLLLGKAEFHKADFLGAVGTFNYIMRHFSDDQDVVAACRLWVIRSYAELGWIYEAEDMLSKIDQKTLRGDNVGLYASVLTDILLKKHQYKEAVPFLELALKMERDKSLQLRFTYLLAQLYEQAGNKKSAYDTYSDVIKKSPPYEMAFNARIARAGLFLGNMAQTRRELNKMIRNNNNKDYLDQLYSLMGKSYLHQKDTVKAFECFGQAVELSTRNGADKAFTLVTMGDLYYDRKNYVKAHPCYDEASKILTVDNEDYSRVSLRAEKLAGLVVEYETVQLQDSLQRLSAMSPENRLKSIQAYIARLEAEEKVAAEKAAARAEREAEQQTGGMNNMLATPGMGGQGEWYFYNISLVRGGQTDFASKWGNRKLEDNWRRLNKSSVLFDDNGLVAGQQGEAIPGEGIASDSIAQDNQQAQENMINDTKNPEFYLRQIPVTPEQIARSNEIWSEALYKTGVIYQEDLEDFPLALDAYGNYLTRFPEYQHGADALYRSYMLCVKTGRDERAEQERLKLIGQYPESKYASMLADPNYIENRRKMLAGQDTIYKQTYEAYNRSDFRTVFANTDSVVRKYPMTTLMPKFLFLRALSIAKTSDQDAFETALNELLQAYPESDVSSMSKDLLALLKQGKEAQHGSTHGTMLARRETEMSDDAENANVSFSADKNSAHRLILISKAGEVDLYPLQFQLAIYNFSKFLLKDFELKIASIGKEGTGISVYDFDGYEDAGWYLDEIKKEPEIKKLMDTLKVVPLIISEFNYSILNSRLTLDDYRAFITENKNE